MRLVDRPVCIFVVGLMLAATAAPLAGELLGHPSDHTCNDLVCMCPPGCREHHRTGGAAARQGEGPNPTPHHAQAGAEAAAYGETGVFCAAYRVCSLRPLAAMPTVARVQHALLRASVSLPDIAVSGRVDQTDPRAAAPVPRQPVKPPPRV